jgi:multidrug resistance efflux pump
MTTIIRRVMRLAIVALVLGGGYYLGSRYLWPAPDTRTIQTVGIIEAPEVNITSRIAGRIVQLDLIEGDTVERAQVVCRTEDIDIKNQLAKARGDLANASAALRNAELTMARNGKLYAEHVISAKERDDARTALDSNRGAVTAAQANVQFYTDQLNDTVIRAPIAGTVVSKNLEIGEWVTPGTPILTVDDLSTIWARVNMEETELGAIRIGSPAEVTLPTRPPLVFSGAGDGDRAGGTVRDRDRRAPRTPGHPHLLRQSAGAPGNRAGETGDDRRGRVCAQQWNRNQQQYRHASSLSVSAPSPPSTT